MHGGEEQRVERNHRHEQKPGRPLFFNRLQVRHIRTHVVELGHEHSMRALADRSSKCAFQHCETLTAAQRIWLNREWNTVQNPAAPSHPRHGPELDRFHTGANSVVLGSARRTADRRAISVSGIDLPHPIEPVVAVDGVTNASVLEDRSHLATNPCNVAAEPRDARPKEASRSPAKFCGIARHIFGQEEPKRRKSGAPLRGPGSARIGMIGPAWAQGKNLGARHSCARPDVADKASISMYRMPLIDVCICIVVPEGMLYVPDMCHLMGRT